MNKILEYDVFVFDFDGTIMNTEKIHHKAWNKILSKFTGKNININTNDFYKYYHSLIKNYSKNYLYLTYNITHEEYDILYKEKQSIYEELIKTEPIELINGVENFLNFILNNNKRFIIVSNTSKKFIDILKIKDIIII